MDYLEDNLLIQGVSKTYPNGVKALDDLSLEITKGMFGLLGPNGAGKSSLMRTLATLQEVDQGNIRLGKIDILQNPMQLRQVLGYLPQTFGVYPRESADRLLNYFALLKGIQSKLRRQQKIEEVLELTNLTAHRKKSVSSYSGGMKQRFGIAQLLLNDPKLIIVDEPTAGLDPAERNRFLNVLRELGSHRTIIFSTHIVEDVSDLCTDMAIMKQGKILQHENPRKAIHKLTDKIWTTTIDRAQLEHYQNQYQILSYAYNEDQDLDLRIYAIEQPAPNFSILQPKLEDVYFLALQA